ncbi:hypothetical protein AHF37_12434 [Paragonimus kellicotti]|nr:hypothetical protein AHF37_12434 [Paragonimus kellicotti]
MSDFRRGLTSGSSPEVTSLVESFASEDQLDSDLEADLQQASLISEVLATGAESSSIASSDALLSFCDTTEEPKPSPSRGNKQSTFFRKAILSGVSSQLNSFSSKTDFGSPSCLVSF